jgi:hypothetical protein
MGFDDSAGQLPIMPHGTGVKLQRRCLVKISLESQLQDREILQLDLIFDFVG